VNKLSAGVEVSLMVTGVSFRGGLCFPFFILLLVRNTYMAVTL